jgi:hypothetical protein
VNRFLLAGISIILVMILAIVMLVNSESVHSSVPENSSPSCTMQAGFKCSDFSLDANGVFSVLLEPAISDPINITAIGCDSNITSLQAQSIRPEILIQVGAAANLSTTCYLGLNPFNENTGEIFTGYLIVNYTDSKTGIPQIVYGSVDLKAR